MTNDSSSRVGKSAPAPQGGTRSISIGGNVTGAAITAGDNNTVSIAFSQQTLPPPDQVDARAEFQALREVATPERAKLDRALDDAADELAKPGRPPLTQPWFASRPRPTGREALA